jgi:SAM-dependent MidA family methyltransferase
MEAALYDPTEGFYQRHEIGADGEFVTSPHVSPAFGILLTRQLGDVWEGLGRPDPFTVIELGAGDGTLARRVIETASAVPAFARALRYVAVERSEGARRGLEASGFDARASLRDAPTRVVGCIVANELLDNLPFHRLRERNGGSVEVFVGLNGETFVEVEAEPTKEALDALRSPLGPGEERPVAPGALALVRDIASAVERGYAFLFDYGFTAGEKAPPIRSYRAHRLLFDVLEDPGGRDVTAGVDFAAVAEEAQRAGLAVFGPVRQKQALEALGLAEWTNAVRTRRAEAERAGDARASIRLRNERARAELLTDPDHLGSLRLLALATPALPRPRAIP